MADTTMTQEGDRSGVETPDNKEKARRRVRAALGHLSMLEDVWPVLSRAERANMIATTINMLESAQLLNIKGSE